MFLLLLECPFDTLLSLLAPLSSGAIVLIELTVISILYMYAFGAVKIHPSNAPGFNNRNAKNGETASFFSFYLDTLKFWDVYGTHKLTSELRTPLNPEV